MRELQLPGHRADRARAVGTVRRRDALAAHAYFAPRRRSGARARAVSRTAASTRSRIARPGRRRAWTTRSSGMVLFGLGAGACCAARCRSSDARPAARARRPVRLQPASIPTMAWERIAPHAERAAPGADRRLRRPSTATDRAAGAARRGATAGRAARRLTRVLQVALVAAHRQRREDRDHDQRSRAAPSRPRR